MVKRTNNSCKNDSFLVDFGKETKMTKDRDLLIWLEDALAMIEALPTVKASTSNFSASQIADALEEKGYTKISSTINYNPFNYNSLYWSGDLAMMWNGWTGEVKLYREDHSWHIPGA